MKRTHVILILAAVLSGCAAVPEYTKVVAALAPSGYAGIWTSTTPQKALVSPEDVASDNQSIGNYTGLQKLAADDYQAG